MAMLCRGRRWCSVQVAWPLPVPSCALASLAFMPFIRPAHVGMMLPNNPPPPLPRGSARQEPQSFGPLMDLKPSAICVSAAGCCNQLELTAVLGGHGCTDRPQKVNIVQARKPGTTDCHLQGLCGAGSPENCFCTTTCKCHVCSQTKSDQSIRPRFAEGISYRCLF